MTEDFAKVDEVSGPLKAVDSGPTSTTDKRSFEAAVTKERVRSATSTAPDDANVGANSDVGETAGL